MSEKKIKFEAVCYIQGYGSWCIEVEDGSWSYDDRIYSITVKKGSNGSTSIENKIFRFPVNSTIIEENK